MMREPSMSRYPRSYKLNYVYSDDDEDDIDRDRCLGEVFYALCQARLLWMIHHDISCGSLDGEEKSTDHFNGINSGGEFVHSRAFSIHLLALAVRV